MEKKIIDWLAQLPEPYKTQAIDNCVRQSIENQLIKVTSLAYAIGEAFRWYKTEQGMHYWWEISERAERGEFDWPG